MAEDTFLRLHELTKDDRLELGEQLPAGTVAFDEEQVPEGAYGDLGLSIAIITVSVVALKGFVAWLGLRHADDEFEEEIEIQKGDLRVTRRIKCRKGEPIDEAVARELSTVPGLDVSALLPQP